MSLYRWKRRRWYRLKALNRHGVHSPFVFDLTEQLLNGKYEGPVPEMILPQLPAKYSLLLRRMAGYYGCREVYTEGQITTLQPAGPARTAFKTMRLLPVSGVESPLSATQGLILVLSGIRDNAEREQLWQRLYEDPAVTLSIDLFDLGLLFFEEDFRVKQHFLLKF